MGKKKCGPAWIQALQDVSKPENCVITEFGVGRIKGIKMHVSHVPAEVQRAKNLQKTRAFSVDQLIFAGEHHGGVIELAQQEVQVAKSVEARVLDRSEERRVGKECRARRAHSMCKEEDGERLGG